MNWIGPPTDPDFTALATSKAKWGDPFAVAFNMSVAAIALVGPSNVPRSTTTDAPADALVMNGDLRDMLCPQARIERV